MRCLGFISSSLSFIVLFAASATPIPLYDLYRRTDGLSYSDLSLTAVVYFIGAISALLFMGRISNHLGRKPITLVSYGLTALACVILMKVENATPLIVGRLLLGISCGLASSTVTSYIADSAPPALNWLAATVISCGGMVGLTGGAIISGTLAQYGPYPRVLCYLVMLIVLAGSAILLLCSPETVQRTPGLLKSLRPKFSMPHADRRLYPIAACTFVATWALGGFYQAFGPSIAAQNLGSENVLLAGFAFSSFMIPSAVGGPLNKFLNPVNAQRLGMCAFTLFLGTILYSLQSGSIGLFLLTSALAGIAQGATLTGSIRSLLAGIAPGERAGILSLIYATSYAGAAVTSFIAGRLAHIFDLFHIALCYGGLAVFACIITLIFARKSHPDP